MGEMKKQRSEAPTLISDWRETVKSSVKSAESSRNAVMQRKRFSGELCYLYAGGL